MSLIPKCMSTDQVVAMSDADFERLVVAPGERMCAQVLRENAIWREENKAFLDERYDGITIEEARLRWVTDAERDAVQKEYAAWADEYRSRSEPLAA